MRALTFVVLERDRAAGHGADNRSRGVAGAHAQRDAGIDVDPTALRLELQRRVDVQLRGEVLVVSLHAIAADERAAVTRRGGRKPREHDALENPSQTFELHAGTVCNGCSAPF